MGALHFYPGQKRMLWVVRGKAVVTAEAWGGQEVPDGINFGQMRPHRTTPGHFVVHSYGPYKTKTWAMARIRWGAPLKVEGTGPSRHVLFQAGTSHHSWKPVETLIPSATYPRLQAYYHMLYGDTGLHDRDGDGIPDRWIFNEFGPMAVRYFRDLNNNRVLDPEEHLMGELIHTIPSNEAETERGARIKYTISHGCVHISPNDRDRLVHAGAFKKGTTFIVHSYEARIPVAPPPVQMPAAPEPPAAAPSPPRQIRERTFLDFVVVDQDGTPLAGRRYKLELPDGSVETARLGSDARIERREIDPGSARFTLLPDDVIPATIAAAPPPPPEPAPEEEPAETAAEEPEEPGAELALADLPLDLAQIDIQLVDAEGKPLADQKVNVVLADGSARDAISDSGGAILIADVPSGEFVVSLVD